VRPSPAFLPPSTALPTLPILSGYAFLALRKRWAVPSVPLAPASWLDVNMLGAQHKEQFAGHTMMQFGLASEERGESGRALFVHQNLLKRIGGFVLFPSPFSSPS
jgi:hypothetical protein